MDGNSDDGDTSCPLCLEEMDLTDRQFRPCPCGYQICAWCWHQVVELAEKDGTEGRCPACRTAYDKERVVSTTVSCERLPEFSVEKKHKSSSKSKSKALEERRSLSNVRVIQRNLVYVIGVPLHLANEETLDRHEFFGQYGKILKISISKSGSHTSQPTASIYVTFVKEEDAIRCIQAVNGFTLEGKALRACFGTTKYCNAWIKNTHCNNPECLYLHDERAREDTFTKEEMLAKYGSKSQCFPDITHTVQKRTGIGLPPPATESFTTTTSSHPLTLSGSHTKQPMSNGNSGKQSSLPPAANWGSRVNMGAKVTPAKISSGGKARTAGSSSSQSMAAPTNPVPPTTSTSPANPTISPILGLLERSGSSPSSLVVSSNQTIPEAGRLLRPDSGKQILKNGNMAPADVKPVTFRAGKASESSSESGNKASGNKSLLDVNARSRTQEKLRPFGSAAFLEESCQNSETAICPTTALSPPVVDSLRFKSVAPCLESSAAVTSDDSLQPSRRFPKEATENSMMMPHCASGGSQTVSAPSKVLKESQIETDDSSTPDSSSSTFEENCRHVSASVISNKGPTEKPSDDRKNLEPASFFRNPYNMASDTVEEAAFSVSLNTDCLDAEFNIENPLIGVPAVEECENRELLQSGLMSKENIKLGAPLSHQSSDFMKDQNVYNNGNRLEVEHIKEEAFQNKKVGVAGESDLISGMLAMGIDLWADENPQDFANILFKETSGLKSSNDGEERTGMAKNQNTRQSRFQFARQNESSKESLSRDSSLSQLGAEKSSPASFEETLKFKASGSLVSWHEQEESSFTSDPSRCSSSSSIIPRNFSGRSCDDGLSTNGYFVLNKAVPSPLPPLSLFASSSFSSSSHNLKSSFSAPPGFHSPARTVSSSPPGFSSQKKVDRSLEPKASAGAIQPSLLGSSGPSDIELIDPAIMAVGKGKLPFAFSHASPAVAYDPSSYSRIFPREMSNHMPPQSSIGYTSALQQPNHRLSDASLNSSLQQRQLLEDLNTLNMRFPLNYSEQNSNSMISPLHHQHQHHHQHQYHHSMRDSEFSRLSSSNQQQVLYGSAVSQARLSEPPGSGWDGWNRIHSNFDANSMRLDRSSDLYRQTSNTHTMLDKFLQTQVQEMPPNKDSFFGDAIFRGQNDMGPYDITMPRYLQPH